MVNEVAFEDMKWGSFTKQKNAFNSKLTLKQFADIVLKPNSTFRDKTKDRARFYLNVILKKKKKGGRMTKEEQNELRYGDQYDYDPAITTMEDMQREAMERQMDQGSPNFRRTTINEIIDTIRLIRERGLIVELRGVVEDTGIDYDIIDLFLEGGANIMNANELVDFADNLYNIIEPDNDDTRIQFMQEQDVEESKSDFDVDEIVDDIFGADGAEEEFERITGNRRPRDEDDEDDDVRRRFGEGLNQVMENNMFGHKSIQLSGRPFSL
jgi:hypothetical protein